MSSQEETRRVSLDELWERGLDHTFEMDSDIREEFLEWARGLHPFGIVREMAHVWVDQRDDINDGWRVPQPDGLWKERWTRIVEPVEAS